MTDEPRRKIGGLSALAPAGSTSGLSALERMRGGGQQAAAAPKAVQPSTPAPKAAERPAAPVSAPQATVEPLAAPSAPERPAEAASAPQATEKAAPRPQSRTRAPKAVQKPSVAVEDSPTEKMTTYIARPTRDRAKAAFRATSHLEGDGSFSEFISGAIERELVRREKLYNQGEPYAGDGGRLTAGRPLS